MGQVYGEEDAMVKTGDPAAKQVLLTAADSLASRYDEKVGGISCCDWNPAWHLPLVIDTMAYRFTKDPRMLDAAHKVTDYYLARLPEDSVPNWDFDAPR
jgi:hypothetical protein